MKTGFTKHFLYFTSKEKSGVLFLLFIILLLSAAPFIMLFAGRDKIFEYKNFRREMEILNTSKNQPAMNQSVIESIARETEEQRSQRPALFYFDPNKLDAEGWTNLGVKEKTALTIQKYISKGGRFRKPEDIGKIWSLPEEDVARLLPYVRIPPQEKPDKRISSPEQERKFTQKKKNIKVDINLADTSVFIALPGIGPGFAKRIVNFRTKLGGFYAVDQVAETFGLPDSTFQAIKPQLFVTPGLIKKININTATVEELKTHPYIRYNLANVMVNYRKQHGNFATVEDVKKIMILDDETYKKIEPYLATQ